jgi:hypothetical protein
MSSAIKNDEETQREHISRYSQIGISAVAAAMRYQGGARNPEYAPAVPTERSRKTLPAKAA